MKPEIAESGVDKAIVRSSVQAVQNRHTYFLFLGSGYFASLL